jgi:hypothetical protein
VTAEGPSGATGLPVLTMLVFAVAVLAVREVSS